MLGFSVTARTLRYWESCGLLAKPQREGRYAVYDASLIERAELLAATRPKQMAKLRRRNVELQIVGETLVLRVKPKKLTEYLERMSHERLVETVQGVKSDHD